MPFNCKMSLVYWLVAIHWWDQLRISWERSTIICITHDKHRWISSNKRIINDNCNNQEQSVDHITWRVCPPGTSNHDKLQDDKDPVSTATEKQGTNWWKWNVPILSTEVEYWKKHYRWTNFLLSRIMKLNSTLWSHTILHMWHAIAHGGIINVLFRLP